MTIDQHSDTLNAYLSRLTVNDLRQILAAAEYSQQAQLNSGINEQLRRQIEMRQTVRAAVEGLTQHDRDLIRGITHRALAQEGETA